MDIKNILSKVRNAQKKYSNYTQEQVDKIFYEAAKAANKERIYLAKLAVEETKMGVIEDKITKNHFASEMIYNKFKNTKTVGTFFVDNGLGIEKIYEPIGVIAAISPVTNPTSTAIFKALISLKTRNGVIFSPHPKAWKSTTKALEIVLNAAINAGAPEDIISWLPENSSIEDTNELMKNSDLILATGGSGLVKSAYSSGRPAIGVGAGNCPAIIDSSANIPMAVASIIQSNTFDNGTVCSTENSVIVLEDIYNEFCEELKKQAAYLVSDKQTISKIEQKMFKEGRFGLLNPDIVGQNPQTLGKVFGIDVPEWAKMIFVEAKGYSYDDVLAHEKLSTFVSLYKANNFNEAINIQRELLLLGPGHTSSLYINEEKCKDKIELYKKSINTARLLINTPSSLGAVGDLYNFGLEPSLTLGCGTWGGNSLSENITPLHLLNKKTLAKRRENMLWMCIPEKVYFKFGCLGEALKDLKNTGIKKAFIVTDTFIWSMYGTKVSKILEEYDIQFKIFDDVEPNPSLKTCKFGAKMLESFAPDAIIAIGGGSPLDAAKIMWLFYEEPTVNFADLALCFADIRKRIVRFPNLGKKCKMVCIPTTSGTGSEVTPFAVITDEKTHIKYPLADYALTPNIAIIDSELTLNLPKKLTGASGMDALTHSLEAFVSLLATEFTDPYAIKACKMIFNNLQNAYLEGPNNKKARETVAHAASMAGIAFANAFLGIVHSLSHKIGGHFGVIHGVANAIYLPYVIYYNSQQGIREKQGYFSQNQTMQTRKKYAFIARELGIKGTSETELIDNLIQAIIRLTRSLDIPTSTKEYGVDSNAFYAIIDEMSEEAYDDQCTGANPRIPLISDLKEIFIAAHEGINIPSLSDTSNQLFTANNSIIKNLFKNSNLFASSEVKNSDTTNNENKNAFNTIQQHLRSQEIKMKTKFTK